MPRPVGVAVDGDHVDDKDDALVLGEEDAAVSCDSSCSLGSCCVFAPPAPNDDDFDGLSPPPPSSATSGA